MPGFKVTKKMDDANKARLSLEGSMDEHSNYEQVALDLIDEVVFDFDNITHINSAGIKLWIQWHNRIQEKLPRLKFSFINCPKPYVDQINMVEGFIPKDSIVRSFKVPFYCETCEADKSFTFVLGREYKKTETGYEITVPDATCERSDCEMEPDVVEAKYFRFLK